MLTKLRRRAESEKGFTLIELLVVILIIGILAAIAIPAFLNQRNKAFDSAAKSNLRTAATAEETWIFAPLDRLADQLGSELPRLRHARFPCCAPTRASTASTMC